jgi:hypothetical protein
MQAEPEAWKVAYAADSRRDVMSTRNFVYLTVIIGLAVCAAIPFLFY